MNKEITLYSVIPAVVAVRHCTTSFLRHSLNSISYARALLQWAVPMVMLVALLTASRVSAQESGEPLAVVATVAKVAAADDGQEKLIEADHARPGDVLVYRAVYTNQVPRSLHHIVAAMPIPSGLTYQAESAIPAATEASIDGKSYFPIANPPKGVTPAQWRAVRWPARDLSAGSSFAVELRAQVDTTAAPAHAAK